MLQPALLRPTVIFKGLDWDMHTLISNAQMCWDALGDAVLPASPARKMAHARQDVKRYIRLIPGYLVWVLQGVASDGFKPPLCSQYFAVNFEAALCLVFAPEARVCCFTSSLVLSEAEKG